MIIERPYLSGRFLGENKGMKKVEYKNLKIYQRPTIVFIVIFFSLFGFWGVVKAEYYESGALYSKNLLAGFYINNITAFGYDATIPENTQMQVQFSQNKTDWYNSLGESDGWNNLLDGDYLAENNAINLSALEWTEPYFFYKVSMTTTDTPSSAPTLSEARVYYEEGVAPATSYATSGTLISQNILSEIEINNFITSFYYNLSSLPSGCSAKVQFSKDKSAWYNSSGVENGWDTLTQGTHLIDLTGRGWSGLAFYYKIEFTGDGTATPTLDEIKVNYAESSVFDYPDPLKYGNDITFEVKWLATLSSGVKLYVCKAEDGSSAGCGEGESWCTNSNDFETSQTITCSYTTEEADEGSNNYYIYVCDSSDNCSSAISGTFTVGVISTPSLKFPGGIKLKGGTRFK